MKGIVLTLLALLFVFPASAQVDLANVHPIRVDVVYLASEYLKGRESGTPEAFMAAEYISQRMLALGLQPVGDNGSWYQNFDFRYNTNPHGAPSEGEKRTCQNVVGFLDNGAENTIVIGAHYDHLGMGEQNSLEPNSNMIHNGADDNASGVAGLLHIAKRLVASNAKSNNYLFVAFSGEELGLFGSKAFVNSPGLSVDKMNYMLNMDMVGRLEASKELAITATGTSPVWDPALEALSGLGFKIAKSPSGIGPSDHTSFYLKDIPCLHFFTGAHEDYHKPSDDADLVNFEGIYEISEYLVALIEKLDGMGKIEFTKTKDNDDRKAAAFKVTLGVMPDYAHTDKGMRIDAVIDGRPAAKGGLENGDVVIKIGDHEVGDIYGYMEALSKFEKGQSTNVTVLRGKKKVKKKVTF